jgi:membrane associated rhomboid family serine protease
MIGDRDYMRGSSREDRQPLSIQIIVLLIICFIAENAYVYLPRANLMKWIYLLQWFGVSEELFERGWLWQLLTFQFLHALLNYGGFYHIFFNCLTFYFFGPAVESIMSRWRFLVLYLGGGAFGGLFHAVGHWLLPEHFMLPVVGASAGIAAVLAAFAFLFPSQVILIMGVIPVPAKIFFLFAAAFSIFAISYPRFGGKVAHGAHLGGLIFGYAYARWFLHSRTGSFKSFFRIR